MPRPGAGSGWNSPTTILAALSLIASGGWAYVAIGREDGRSINDRLNAHTAAIAALQAQVEYMREELRRGRPDGGSR